MKILIIQENGKHDRNRKYRECFSLERAFESLGCVCEVWGMGHEGWGSEVDFNSFDLIFNLEQYNTQWLPDLSSYRHPKKFLWSIDAHCRGIDPYENIFHQGKYDILFHSTRKYVEKDYHRWLPNAFDDTLIKPMPNVKKEHFVGFCGNMGNRTNIVNILSLRYDVKLDIFVIGDDMVEAINSYHIHMNRNHSYDFNYRHFETIGCGTVLLTNWNDQLEALGFIDKENCLVYDDKYASIIPHDVGDMIAQYQDNEEELNRIGSNGLALSKKHTYLERAKKILSYV